MNPPEGVRGSKITYPHPSVPWEKAGCQEERLFPNFKDAWLKQQRRRHPLPLHAHTPGLPQNISALPTDRTKLRALARTNLDM